MSEEPLPADLGQWPKSPYQLLGVTPADDAKTIKRAYQRLIRTYRPEEHPEKFRRLREAYEAAYAFAELMAKGDDGPTVSGDVHPAAFPSGDQRDARSPRGDAAAESDDETNDGPNARARRGETGGARDDASARPGDSGRTPRADTFEEELAGAWRCAKQGDLPDAYGALVALGQKNPRRHEPYLGRYWLLRIAANLDPVRNPCEELAECLARAGAARPAVLELYRREIDERPGEALTDRCTRVLRETLAGGSATGGWAAVVAHPRWQEAARRGAWELIEADIGALRRTPTFQDHESWLRLLWSAVEATVGADAPTGTALYEACLQELEQSADARVVQHGVLSQLDYFVEVIKDLRKLRPAGESIDFCRLIAASWSTAPLDLYVELCRLPALSAGNPRRLLLFLTEIGESSPVALGRFRDVVALVARETGRLVETDWTVEQAAPVVADFLNDAPWPWYTLSFRRPLLGFCLQRRLTPREVAQVVGPDPAYRGASDAHLSELIARDAALECAYAAICLLEG